VKPINFTILKESVAKVNSWRFAYNQKQFKLCSKIDLNVINKKDLYKKLIEIMYKYVYFEFNVKFIGTL
jgi:hypothetical protein